MCVPGLHTFFGDLDLIEGSGYLGWLISRASIAVSAPDMQMSVIPTAIE
jgi:hypothetical protein